MDIHVIGNQVEGVFWLIVSAVFLVSLARPPMRPAKAIAAAAFAAFGVSDFVEIRFGSWWQPGWLLAWKVACVAVMVALLLWYWHRKRRERGGRHLSG